MSSAPQDFIKKHDYLICVDSDGCAVDTMDIKHFRCFGPCMVEEWNLQEWKDAILERWNEINLYSLTRGINRFLGLSSPTVLNNKFVRGSWSADDLAKVAAFTGGRLVIQYPDGIEISVLPEDVE